MNNQGNSRAFLKKKDVVESNILGKKSTCTCTWQNIKCMVFDCGEK